MDGGNQVACPLALAATVCFLGNIIKKLTNSIHHL